MKIKVLFLEFIEALAEILPVIFYLSFARRNKGSGLWVIFLYCILSVVTENFLVSGSSRPHIDKFYLFALFSICEYTLYTLFLYFSFKEKSFKYIAILGSLVFYTMAIINFTLSKSANFDSLSASAEAMLTIIYSILFLYEQLKDQSVIYIYQSKKFWIVIAFLLYFSSTLFLFLYAGTVTNQERRSYWYINNIFDIVKNILICIAFMMKKNKLP
ncbi:MAG TPA: hypothetical protein VIH61_05260, partial [Waddliaceae bacterium]